MKKKKKNTTNMMYVHHVNSISNEDKIKEAIDTITWECNKGHWARVEYIMMDEVDINMNCPVCGEKMILGKRKLIPLRNTLFEKGKFVDLDEGE